jgi:predicted O-methyltransferase YrrM
MQHNALCHVTTLTNVENASIPMQLVRPGGVIAIDNVLWYGKVADPDVNDKQTIAVRELNDFLLVDARVVVSLTTVGDGITLCTKKRN